MRARFDHHAPTGSFEFVEALHVGHPDVLRSASPGDLSAEQMQSLALLRSHLAALRLFLATTDPAVAPAAIIVEDDLLLHNSFADRLETTLANLPDGAPLVALGYGVSRWTDIRWAGREPEQENLATLHPSYVFGSQAYWISRAAAARLIELLDRPQATLPQGIRADAITRWSGGFIAYPPLMVEESPGLAVGDEALNERRAGSRGGFPIAEYTSSERHARTTTIALAMIVRDEAAVIERCLASVRHLIDHWVICDTGSTDETVDLVERSLQGIPGSMHRCEWVDFGHNRSELLRLAQGSADYLLLLDADQTLREIATLPPLSADAYRLRHAGSMEYDITRLVRSDLPWRYEGRTHEYITCDQSVSNDSTLAWQVVHHGDGGSRGTKFQRDRQLLELTLEERPDDARTVFYLAQTMEALGERERARDLYERRSRMGGFEEEAWFAQLRGAVLLAATDPVASLGRLLECWQRRPARLEPIHEAAMLCEHRGWWQIARAMTAAVLDVERPNDILFVERWLYDGGIRDDHARACAALGVVSSAPAVAGAALATLESLVAGARFARLELHPAPPWPLLNPSITLDGDGYALVVRTANYRLEGNRYQILDDEGRPTAEQPVRTRNYFVRLDGDFVATHVFEIEDESGRVEFESRIRGLEDCRLFRWQGAWWVAATVRDSTPSSVARMVLGRLDVDGAGARLAETFELPPPHPDQHEKNWAPLIDGDELRLVYRWHPLRVTQWNGRELAIVEERLLDPQFGNWRGSSQGVPVEGGWLFVVHEVAVAGEHRRYQHRFVHLGGDGSVRCSPLFTFTGAPIEFAAGMAVRDDTVVVSFGVSDATAGFTLLPLAGVLDTLAVP